MKRTAPLSISRIKNAKAIDHDLWLSDDNGTRGLGRLYLRVSPGGSKRFYYRYPRAGGAREVTVPLGLCSRTKMPNHLTLVEARAVAAKLSAVCAPASPAISGLRVGTNVETAPVAASKGLKVREVCSNYVTFLKSENAASTAEVQSVFERFVYRSPLADVPAGEATKEQFMELLRAALQQSTHGTQRKLKSYLHSAFNRLLIADNDMASDAPPVDAQIKANPLAKITSTKKGGVRERNLKTDELRALWKRMQLPSDGSASVELRAARLTILLGGQRGIQLVRVERVRLDLEAGTILLMDTKGKGRRAKPREHLLPLPVQAKDELMWLDNYSKGFASPYVFAGAKPGKHMADRDIGRTVTALCKEMLAANECDTPFHFANFRSTVETQLAELGVPSDVMQYVQSHGLSGTQIKHYIRYKYFAEKLKALELLERLLRSLLDGSDPGRWDAAPADKK